MKSRFKFIICAAVILSMLIGTVPAQAAVKDAKSVKQMISYLDQQNFTGTTTRESVKKYINHFTYDSKYAAFYGKKFDYPNSGKNVETISDGTYTVSDINGKGCYAYAKFVSKVIYGKHGSRKYHTEKAKKLTGKGLKTFLLQEAQAGEHIRIDGTHSVVFVSGDNNGFYYFHYNGDGYGKKILLIYKTYADFAAKYNKVSSKEKSSIWLYNANTNKNTGKTTSASGNNTASGDSSTKTPASAANTSSITISPNSYPTGNLQYGKDFTLTAKFTSDCAIKEARAYMLDANKKVIQEAKGSSTTKNYYVKGYALDKGMKFDQLSPGTYYLKYYVKDANGDTKSWTSPKFNIVKESAPAAVQQVIADGTYVISTKLNSDFVLDIDGASEADGANLQLWEKNETPAQSFKVKHIGNGYYQIINTNSGKALDAEGGGTEEGTNVWQYEVNNTDAQIWKITSAGNGYYHIVCKKSGLYLDLNNANVDYGENIKLWGNNGEDAQKWMFTKIS